MLQTCSFSLVKNVSHHQKRITTSCSQRQSCASRLAILHEKKSMQQVSHEDLLLRINQEFYHSSVYPSKPSSLSIDAMTRSTFNNIEETVASAARAEFHRRSTMRDSDELEKDEERNVLSGLNARFVTYLDRIKELVKLNKNLRSHIDQTYLTCLGQTGSVALMDRFRQSCQQINQQVHEQTRTDIRSQRAAYDRKSYGTSMKILLMDDQEQKDRVKMFEQQLEAKVYELEQWQKQHKNQEHDLQTSKQLYNDYLSKLMTHKDQYDTVIFDRMQKETAVSTLQEQVLFERSYQRQRREELKNLDKIHYDLNRQFNQTEYANIVEKIREDYQKYNDVQLEELEASYQAKLEVLRVQLAKNIDEVDPEEAKELIDENQSLERKLVQLEKDLDDLIEQNHEEDERFQWEYEQLQVNLPDFESDIIQLRDANVHLWSEIHTYQCLLINLASLTEQRVPSVSRSLEQTVHHIEELTGFKVHTDNELVWVRI